MSNNLRKLQLADLELLKKFIIICEEHRLNYFALGGTLLGAIRHKGFIPWDDDIDIGLPREDYVKFLELSRDGRLPFEVHSYQNDKNHKRYFARIEDPSIKVKRNDKKNEEISSAWIDIFPLDGMPNNGFLRKLHQYHILFRRAIYRLSSFNSLVNVNKKNRPLIERILVFAGKTLPVEKIFNVDKELRKLDKVLNMFPYSKSNFLVNAMGAYKFDEMFDKKYYGDGQEYQFEDITIRGPKDYDFVCSQLYGDYMTPPSKEERNHHESEIID